MIFIPRSQIHNALVICVNLLLENPRCCISVVTLVNFLTMTNPINENNVERLIIVILWFITVALTMLLGRNLFMFVDCFYCLFIVVLMYGLVVHCSVKVQMCLVSCFSFFPVFPEINWSNMSPNNLIFHFRYV